MEYNPPIGGAADDPYVDANPGTGTEGSPVPAAAIEHPQREIVAVIEAAGLAPDSGNLAQLLAAINALIAAAAGSNAYDVPFNAGYSATMSGQDLAVQTYGEMVVGRAITLTGEAGYIGTAGTDAAVIVDIEKNGVSVYATKPQFAAAANALTPGVLKSDGTEIFAAGDRMTFKVTQVGSTVAGQALRFTAKATVN